MQQKILWRGIFLGALENEYVDGFPLRRDGNILAGKNQHIYGSSQHENILVLLQEKILQCCVISEYVNLVE